MKAPEYAPKAQQTQSHYAQSEKQKAVVLPLLVLEIGEEAGHGALHPQLGEDGQAEGHPQQELPQADEFRIEVAREEEQEIQSTQAYPDVGQEG